MHHHPTSQIPADVLERARQKYPNQPDKQESFIRGSMQVIERRQPQLGQALRG